MAEVPVSATTVEEEEALFGLGPAQGAGHPGGNPFDWAFFSSDAAHGAAATESPTSAPPESLK